MLLKWGGYTLDHVKEPYDGQDEWGMFCVSKGFATQVNTVKWSSRSHNNDKLSILMRLICLMMVPMADAGGGRHVQLPSSLMCGSNAAGEPMPLHIMFSSTAEEENMAVKLSWIAGLPTVTWQFGHDVEKTFPASVTVNEKGRTDARVLRQVREFW